MEEWLKIALAAGAAALFGAFAGIVIARPDRDQASADRNNPTAGPLAAPGVAAQEPVGVQPPKWDAEFQRQLEATEATLKSLPTDSDETKKLAADAREALDNGDLARAVLIMDQLCESEVQTGREMRDRAKKNMAAAASVSALNGDLRMAQGDYQAAAKSYAKAAESLPDDDVEGRTDLLTRCGTAAFEAGDLDTALWAFQGVTGLIEQHRGGNHPDLAAALNNMALVHFERGEYRDAEPQYLRALAIDERALGRGHPGVATDLLNIAIMYRSMGAFEDAEEHFRRAVAINQKAYDGGHPVLVDSLRAYAALLRDMGRNKEATVLERRAAVGAASSAGAA